MTMCDYLDLAVTSGDGVAVVSAAGEMDIFSAKVFQDAIGEAIRTGADKVIVDLAGVSFIDARGIKTLVQQAHRLRDNGRAFAIRRPSPAVLRMEQLAAVDTSLLVVDLGD